MKIVNAVWEERNLGVKSAEIEIDVSDVVQEVESSLKDVEQIYEYIAIKVPSSRTDVTWLINSLGYSFVEDMIFFEHDLHTIVRTPLQQRMYDAVKILPMQDNDFEILNEEISKGSFAFDRISNDPYFGKDKSIIRFLNWIQDERERGALFFKGMMHGEMTGFFILRDLGEGIYTSALGGTFMKWRKGGLGTNIQTIDIVKQLGGKKIVLGVSTNNMIQIRALIQNGFFPIKTNHVFVKHIE